MGVEVSEEEAAEVKALRLKRERRQKREADKRQREEAVHAENERRLQERNAREAQERAEREERQRSEEARESARRAEERRKRYTDTVAALREAAACVKEADIPESMHDTALSYALYRVRGMFGNL